MRASRFLHVAMAAALGTIAVPIVAGAVGGNDSPARYTGCLKSGGAVYQLKSGDAPKAACLAGETQITLGSGDITRVAAGTGLQGGAVEGVATLGIAPAYALPQGCASGQAPKRYANGWYCGTDYGSFAKSVDGLSVASQGANSICYGDLPTGEWHPPDSDIVKSATFSLPTGSYLATVPAGMKWRVTKTYDREDGEQFAQGSAHIQLVRTRAGTETVVQDWSRSVSENLWDGAGWNNELGTFLALAGDSYHLEVWTWAVSCSRAEISNGGLELTRVG